MTTWGITKQAAVAAALVVVLGATAALQGASLKKLIAARGPLQAKLDEVRSDRKAKQDRFANLMPLVEGHEARKARLVQVILGFRGAAESLAKRNRAIERASGKLRAKGRQPDEVVRLKRYCFSAGLGSPAADGQQAAKAHLQARQPHRRTPAAHPVQRDRDLGERLATCGALALAVAVGDHGVNGTLDKLARQVDLSRIR